MFHYELDKLYLHLGSNRIGDQGVASLALALAGRRIHCLDLQNNGIGDRGMVCLAEARPAMMDLELLDLRYNRIGNEGVASLAEALGALVSLNRLYLSGNETITYRGVALLKARAQPNLVMFTV